MTILAVEEFLRFSAKRRDDAGKVKGLVVWSAQVDAWVATKVRRLTEQETRESQGQKLYADSHSEICWN